jgi:hypothetical protein
MGDKGLRMNFAFGLLRDWWLSKSFFHFHFLTRFIISYSY